MAFTVSQQLIASFLAALEGKTWCQFQVYTGPSRRLRVSPAQWADMQEILESISSLVYTRHSIAAPGNRGRIRVQGHPCLHIEFEASLGCMKLSQKDQKKFFFI